MFEALFILIAGGVLLAAAIPKTEDVRPTWLRLAGVIAVVAAALGAALAAARDDLVQTPPFFRRNQAVLIGLTLLCALAHLVAARFRLPRIARAMGGIGFVIAVLAGSNLLHDAMLTRGTAVAFPPKLFAMVLQTVSSAGAGAVVGLALMTALFPAFGIRADSDTAAATPSAAAFERLYGALLVALALRALVAVGVAMVLQASRPVPSLWTEFGWLIPPRWLVGLVAVYLLAATARRRLATGAALSATAFLLVGALLAADAEALALYLVRETGLPF